MKRDSKALDLPLEGCVHLDRRGATWGSDAPYFLRAPLGPEASENWGGGGGDLCAWAQSSHTGTLPRKRRGTLNQPLSGPADP